MKKLILLLSIVLLSFTMVKAQSGLKPLQSDTSIHKAGLDTASNTGAVAQIIQIGGYWSTVTIQSGVTKLTGTPGGSLKLYGSVDNIKYDYATTATDSLAVSNVSTLQVKTWKINPSQFQFYKVIYKPTGTQTSTITSTALWRK